MITKTIKQLQSDYEGKMDILESDYYGMTPIKTLEEKGTTKSELLSLIGNFILVSMAVAGITMSVIGIYQGIKYLYF